MEIKENTAGKLFHSLYSQLKEQGEEQEIKSRIYILLEEKYGLDRTSIIADQELSFTRDQYNQLTQDIIDLSQGVPVQHLTGYGYFYGRTFKVNDQVLIPRPETEELVHEIILGNPQKGLKILDVGTGSGCIPITLFLELKQAEVFAVDVSQSALKIAKENNQRLKAEVNFFKTDILKKEPGIVVDLDILVSNPPYVPDSEKQQMQKEVVEHEPHVALFVPSKDPLLFYNRIADLGITKLKPDGQLYFEIHKDYGESIKEMLMGKGYKEVSIHKDINQKDRIVKARK